MATKYDVLAKLIERDAEAHKHDQAGNYKVLLAVVKEISEPHASEDELVDALYDLIAECFVGDSPDAESRRPLLPPAPESVPRSAQDGPSPLTMGF